MSNIKDELKSILGKELTDKVKSFLKLNATPVKVEVKLDDITLNDGTILTVDKMEVGANATITTADGVVTAPDGEYTSQDGTVITVMGGLVAEIATKQEEAPEAPETAPAAMDAITELKAIIAKLEKQSNENLTKLVKENKSLKVELASQKAGLQIALSAIDKIAETPVAISLESQSTPKVNLNDIPYEKMTNYQKLQYNRNK
jgi:hypothetical protein